MYKIGSDRIIVPKRDDSVSHHTSRDGLKSRLVNFIYRSIDLARFKYSILRSEDELLQLLETKFFVSANFSGLTYFLIFNKINDKFCSFLVDRKTLKYNKAKVNINEVNITKVDVKLDFDIYNGTILDGILIKNRQGTTFIITDVFTFKGEDYTDIPIDTKLKNIRIYLDNHFDGANRSNTINLAVNKLFPLCQTRRLVEEVIPSMKNFVVHGICFYPEISNTKLIYIFNKSSNKNDIRPSTTTKSKSTESKETSVEEVIVPPETKIITNISYYPKTSKHESYVFELKKTEDDDVYILNIVEPEIKKGKTCYKRVKVGLAYVPTLQRSKWCNEIFRKDGNEKLVDSILVHCKYHRDKNKWEPVSIANNAKRPSLVEEFIIQ